MVNGTECNESKDRMKDFDMFCGRSFDSGYTLGVAAGCGLLRRLRES